jgi:hypothetical protein
MAASWWIDETKAARYVVVAAVIDSADIADVRAAMRSHLRGSQRAIHFNSETDAVRRAALATIAAAPVAARVYRYGTKATDAIAREACIRQIARDARAQGVQRLVIELDTSFVESDELWLREELGSSRNRSLWFDHRPKRADPLLWVADGIAWCLQRDAAWRRLLDGLAVETFDLP